MKKSDQTIHRILDAARSLFNEKGFFAVNTHQIALRAELSPGNLYYHFKNKEEIVRRLFLEIPVFQEKSWSAESLGSFPEFIRFFFSSLSEFEFFFRDFATILQSDHKMKKLWRETYETLFARMRKAVARWVEAGIMKPFDDKSEIDGFIDNAWIVSMFAASFVKAKKKGDSMTLLVHYLMPYHTARGKNELCRLSRRNAR